MSGRVLWKREVECETKTDRALVEVVHWEDEFGGHRTIDVEDADFLGIDDAEALAATITEAVKVARDGAA